MTTYKNLNLSHKILLGYIFSLLLIIIVGSVAINRLFVLNETINNLATDLTVDRQIPNDMIARMLEARYYGAQYVHTHETGFWQEYLNALSNVENDLSQAAETITDVNLVNTIETLQNNLAGYKETYDQINVVINQQDEIKKNTLDVQSSLGEKKISKLLDWVYLENDLMKYRDVSQLHNAWALMRGDVLDYIKSGNSQALQEFNTHHNQIQSLIKVLSGETQGEDKKALLSEINAAVDSYAVGFQNYQAAYLEQNDLQSKQLDVYEQNILADAALLGQGVGDEFDIAAENADSLVKRAEWILIVTMAFLCLVNIICGLQIARSITKPLHKVMDASRQIADVDLPALSDDMNALAEGDLTREWSLSAQKIDISAKDEIGKLAQSFDAITERLHEVMISFRLMIENLRKTITAVAENAGHLSAASTQLAASANQASLATTQIAATIQQVAKGTTQQSESVNRTAASVENMSLSIESVARGAQEQAASVSKASNLTMQISSTIQQVAGNASAVTDGSASTSEAANRGSTTVQGTIQEMQSIKEKVDLSVQKVQEMGQRSGEIGLILETIEDIASQTNLLALNAAIEAARAGEHGRGFAVVADEVRKLAERSSSATKEIANLIQGIQATVNEAVIAMKESASEVESGVVLANQAGGALDAITNAAQAVLSEAEHTKTAASKMAVASDELVTAMDSVSEVVEENTMATESMATASNEVSTAIENIASVSEENSAAIEEVSASTEEMSAQVEEVTASAQSLADMARALQALVEQFKLETASDMMGDDASIPEPEDGQKSKSIYLGPDRRAPMINPAQKSNGGNGQKVGIQN